MLTSGFIVRDEIKNGEENPRKNLNLFEGDIVLTKKPRNGIPYLNSRWAKNQEGLVIVPYTIRPNAYSSNHINLMRSALDDIQQKVSCIRFIQRSNQNDYIEVVNGLFECSSFVGRIGGRQRITLARVGCMDRGTIVHEFLHALGFWHMQSSSDRDDYVKINWQNIRQGEQNNFMKWNNSNRFGTPYDYRSVMHYGAYDFSKNRKPTIEPLSSSISLSSLGQREGMTEGDIERLKKMYDC